MQCGVHFLLTRAVWMHRLLIDSLQIGQYKALSDMYELLQIQHTHTHTNKTKGASMQGLVFLIDCCLTAVSIMTRYALRKHM
jgi:hypothetical protein